jgi:hypothetical protein
MWFNLVAEAGPDPLEGRVTFGAKNRDVVSEKMTPAQLAEAQKLAREWRPKLANASQRGVRDRGPDRPPWLLCREKEWVRRLGASPPRSRAAIRRAREIAELPQTAPPRRHQGRREGPPASRNDRQRVEASNGWRVGAEGGAIAAALRDSFQIDGILGRPLGRTFIFEAMQPRGRHCWATRHRRGGTGRSASANRTPGH